MIKTLEWDSDFFGIKVGELFLDSDLKIDQPLDYDLIYVKSNSEFNLSLDNYTNTFGETKILFAKELKALYSPNKDIKSISEIDYDINQIYELAYESGKHSRFKLDEKIRIENFQKLYKTWVDNSINYKFATDVLLYKIESIVAGFVTYKIESEIATIGLIAVSEIYQGQGIGKNLLQELENRLVQNKIKQLNIPTQLENIQACNFYKKNDYHIIESTNIKHYWKFEKF